MHSIILDRWLTLNYIESDSDCRKYASNIKCVQFFSATFDRKIFHSIFSELRQKCAAVEHDDLQVEGPLRLSDFNQCCNEFTNFRTAKTKLSLCLIN
jgi:hypothetical protein